MDSNWTEDFYEGAINMTYQDLVKCIGEPHFEGGDFMIQKEWHFEMDDLAHFSIYDWERTDSDRDVTDGKVVEWHIAHDGMPGTLAKIKSWLHDKGVKVDKSMYYKIKTPDVNTNIQVEKKDILKIGNSFYNEGGFLAIVCNEDSSNIEEILLRSILKCFGDEYKVIREEDYKWNDDNPDEVYEALFVTNLPYEMYEILLCIS